MSFSSDVYTTNGTVGPYAVTFPYISRNHVEVYVGGVLVPSTNYTWPTSSSVQFNSPQLTGQTLVVRRNTPKPARLVDYQNGNGLDADTLDLDSTQLLYIAQENLDAQGIPYDPADNKYDAQGSGVKNLATPQAAADAATKAYVDAVATGALLSPAIIPVQTLIMDGPGARISGDFSNSTISSRTHFQTSTPNGVTSVGILPNGSSPQAGVALESDSALGPNAAVGILKIDAVATTLASTARGAGVPRPLRLEVGQGPSGRLELTDGGSATLGVGLLTAGGRTLTVANADAGAGSWGGFVGSSNAGSLRLQANSVAAGALGYIATDSGMTNGLVLGAEGATGTLQFQTNGAERLRIRSDGSMWAAGNTRPVNGMTRSTPVTLTGSSQADVVNIPSWATRVTVETVGAVHSINTAFLDLQLRSGGGVVSTGYQAVSMWFGAGGQSGLFTTGQFRLLCNDAIGGGAVSRFVMTRVPGTNTWAAAGTNNPFIAGSGYFTGCSGQVSLAGDLDGVRIVTTLGTFTAGQMIVTWE